MHNPFARLSCLATLVTFVGCTASTQTVQDLDIEPASTAVEHKARYTPLALVKAPQAYARGATGKGVTVGVFDTGATETHPQLERRYRLASGFREKSPGIKDTEDRHGHGTKVAGVIAAERGNQHRTHGIAYEARIASYKAFGPGDYDGAYARGMEWFAENGVHIVNHSWGTAVAVPDESSGQRVDVEAILDDARAYQERGGVQIWAAGNGRKRDATSATAEAGIPHRHPELEKSWIAVTVVNEVGVHPSVGVDDPRKWRANRCGVARDWCLAAPGQQVRTTSSDAGHTSFSGASAAAAHVSGALAVLKSRFPDRSMQALRTRLLDTANNRGHYANEAIYGRGLLDLDAASRPDAPEPFAKRTTDNGAHRTRVEAPDGP